MLAASLATSKARVASPPPVTCRSLQLQADLVAGLVHQEKLVARAAAEAHREAPLCPTSQGSRAPSVWQPFHVRATPTHAAVPNFCDSGQRKPPQHCPIPPDASAAPLRAERDRFLGASAVCQRCGCRVLGRGRRPLSGFEEASQREMRTAPTCCLQLACRAFGGHLAASSACTLAIVATTRLRGPRSRRPGAGSAAAALRTRCSRRRRGRASSELHYARRMPWR